MESKTNKTQKIVLAILGLFFLFFIYIILWFIFKDNMPFHTYLQYLSDNFDYFAKKIVFALPLFIISVLSFFLLRPTPTKRFLRLQASLSTSRIKSVAMGLVEVQGVTMMEDFFISPVGKEKCIGYEYRVETVYRDSDGKDSYRLFKKENLCKDFFIKDDTGSILVKPNGLEFIFFESTNVKRINNERHTETLLKENREVLLVGKANSDEGKFFIEKDPYYKILGITFSDGISIWNKYNPLFKSFVATCFLILVAIAIILLY